MAIFVTSSIAHKAVSSWPVSFNEAWSLSLEEEQRIGENRLLTKIFGSMEEE
jgi:hypothetical protein